MKGSQRLVDLFGFLEEIFGHATVTYLVGNLKVARSEWAL